MRYPFGFDTNDFRREVRGLLEHDYGDFMRAANHSLNRLREERQVLGDHNIERRLNRMRTYLLYSPSWDITETRKKLDRDAQYLEDILQGHDQDWESASSTFNVLNGTSRSQ